MNLNKIGFLAVRENKVEIIDFDKDCLKLNQATL